MERNKILKEFGFSEEFLEAFNQSNMQIDHPKIECNYDFDVCHFENTGITSDIVLKDYANDNYQHDK